jgi:hypothetical protein
MIDWTYLFPLQRTGLLGTSKVMVLQHQMQQIMSQPQQGVDDMEHSQYKKMEHSQYKKMVDGGWLIALANLIIISYTYGMKQLLFFLNINMKICIVCIYIHTLIHIF